MKRENLFISNELMGSNYHRQRFGKLTFRALALRQSERQKVTLETSAFQIFHGGNSTFKNSNCK